MIKYDDEAKKLFGIEDPKCPAMNRSIIESFKNACDVLGVAFCRQLDVSSHKDDAWWVDYGSTFAFGAGEMFVSAEEMMLVLEHNMTYDDFSDWYWRWCDFDPKTCERKPGRINLRSWLMGARYDNEDDISK